MSGTASAGRARVPALTTLVVGLLAVMVVLLVAHRGDLPYRSLGLTPPPDAVRYLTPLVRAITDLAGGLTVGGLLVACAVLPSGREHTLGAHAYAALRRAGACAGIWVAGALAQVVLVVADGSGQDLGVVGRPGFGATMAALQEPVAWLVTAVAAGLAAVVARSALTWRVAVGALVLAAFALVPPVVAGRVASVGADHDVVTDAGLLVTAAAAVWLGVAVAVLAHRRRGGPHPDLVRRRATGVLAATAVVAVPAGVAAAVGLVPDGPATTSYGLGVVLAAAALVVAVVALAARGTRHSLAVQAGAAAVLVTLLAVLASDVPPALLVPSTAQQALLGFTLAAPPTVGRLLVDGRVNVLFDLAALVLAGAYLAGVYRLRHRGDAWPVGRTMSWLGGCALIVVATSSGLGRYAMAMFSAHMGLHMLLSMLAPILLVLGGPITLALRALPAVGPDRPDGPREWIVALTGSRAARVLTHPLIALALFVGSFYALYFSPIYAAALPFHWAHQLMDAHFLLVGFLFFWPIIGIDHAPTSLPHVGRLGLLLASMPFHAFFGVALLASDTVIGQHFFAELALPWVPDLLADQNTGGGIAWASGELPLLAVIITLLVQWSRHDERDAARYDRRADRDGDAELAAWNAMYADMARGRAADRSSDPASP